MSKMKVLAAGSALAAATLAGTAVADVTGTVNVTSEYVFRGITSSNGSAVQGSLDWADAGWHAGIWGSNTAPFSFDGTEVDLYGGYTFDLGGGSSIDVGAIYYVFPESEQITGAGIAFDADYWEVYVGFSAAGFAAKLYYADEFFGDLSDDGVGGVKGEDSIYFNLSYTAPIKEGLDFTVAVGQQSGDGAENFFFGDDVVDYSFSLTKALENGFAASFAIVGTDLDNETLAPGITFDDDPKFVVSLAKGFDI